MQLVGCMATHQAFERNTRKSSLVRHEVPGIGFRHAVYTRGSNEYGIVKPLHVYLTGDGIPYVRTGLIAADPTPRHPVALKLMALDPAPAILLGRPCYHGYADSPPCSSTFWTHARYGEEVIASMADVLSHSITAERELVLIGFSGGGALVMLLAQQVPGVVAVITIAANLDIDAWADLHGYTRLRASLNPVEAPPLDEGVVQLHYAGAKDTRVPPELLRDTLNRLGSKLTVLPDASHARGWERHWPAILKKLDSRLER